MKERIKRLRYLLQQIVAIQDGKPASTRRGQILFDRATALMVDASTTEGEYRKMLQSLVSHAQERLAPDLDGSATRKNSVRILLRQIAKELNTSK